MTIQSIVAYTDGACKGNGKQNGTKAGGFGVHIVYPNGDVLDLWGGEADTTNNRMELMAVITAVERTPHNEPLHICSDSNYVIKGITTWIANWKKKHWKDIKNPDLWQRLDTACQHRPITWEWVKGHNGHAGNEQADYLANLGVSEQGERLILANTPAQPSPLPNHTNQAVNMNHKSPITNTASEHAPLDTNFDSDNAVILTESADANETSASDVAKKTKSAKKKPKPIAIKPCDHQNPDYNGDTSCHNPNFWPIIPDLTQTDATKGMRQLIMDTETTGFEERKGDRVVEIGIIEYIGRKPTGRKLHVYLNPDIPMPEETFLVHGIGDEFLADKPRFSDVADYVYGFMQGAEILAHNAPFDMRFLQMEFEQVGKPDFLAQVQVTDTLALARQLYPGQKNTLDALVKRLDITQRDRSFHGALLDSEILAEVYLAMTSGQIAMSIDEERTNHQEDSGDELVFGGLDDLASLLINSPANLSADAAWRSAVLQNH